MSQSGSSGSGSGSGSAVSGEVDDSVHRQAWTTGSNVQIYSNSRKKWFVGDIAQIFHDSEGEWLEVRYDKSMSKQVQRYSTDIKPTEEELAKLKQASAAKQQQQDIPFAESEIQQRTAWGKGANVQIFSNTHKEWYTGEIVDIIKDEEGEWLNVVWHRDNGEAMSKQVQRFSTDVRPVPSDKEEGSTAYGNTTASLADEIKARKNAKRGAPPFSRTLRSSTWTFPATQQFRRSKKLVDINEEELDNEDVSVWRSNKVIDFLKSLGKAYDIYAPKFRGVNGPQLLKMNDEDLIKMGLPKLHRVKIALELQKLTDASFKEEIQGVDVLNWDPRQVKMWCVKKHPLSQYANIFFNHGIDGLLLFELDEEDLQTMDVRPFHRSKILDLLRDFSRDTFPEQGPGAGRDDDEKHETSNSLRKGGRRDSRQINLTDLADISSARMSVSQDPDVINLLSDMSSLLSKLSSLFNVPPLNEAATQIENKVQSLMRKYPGSSEFHGNDAPTEPQSNSASPPGKRKKPPVDAEVRGGVGLPQQMQNWVNTQEHIPGHKRRDSLQHVGDDVAGVLQEGDSDEDLSDLD